MYSFEPNEEQKMLLDAVSQYSINELRKAAHDAEENQELPAALVSKGWEFGVLQTSIPEAYGGFGERSVVTGVLAAEEFAYGDLAGALAIGLPSLFAIPIMLAGSEQQKQQYLPAITEGDWKPYTAALIETSFDFDPADLKSSAKAEGGDYFLNGEKTMVPYAATAEAMIVYARLKDETRAFIVPKDAPGLKIGGEREKYMGLNAIPFYKVTLEDVKVPQASLLPGAVAPLIDASRVALAAMAVGVARAAFEYSRDYAKERDVFGVKVAQKQAIAFMLAEMITEIEAIRLLVWEGAWALDNAKEDSSQKAFLALSGAMDMVMMVTDRAVQILGGHGYIRDHPVELWMRNGRGIATFTGLAMV